VNLKKEKRCLKISASFSMNVMDAKKFGKLRREIVAYIALLEQANAHPGN
jgi:hypothetical protein